MAEAAGVRQHAILSSRDGLLHAQQLIATVPDWLNGSVWFCSPAAFGPALREGLTAQGLAGDDFHQEAFEFR